MALPHFIVIGAMRSGTTMLHAQLAAQPGVFMPLLKEPDFFSEDAVYARGLAWYESLFAGAQPDALIGEASTSYAKAPTYPHCVERLIQTLPQVRLVYVVRDPFDRLVSQYIHEWTIGLVRANFATALAHRSELVDYSRYAMQIMPYVARFGVGCIHVVEFEAMIARPEATFAELGRFLGARQPFVWRSNVGDANASLQRVRRLPLHRVLLEHPVSATLRRTLVPKPLRRAVRRLLRVRRKPEIPPDVRERLRPIFAKDREELERLFPHLRPDVVGPQG